MVPVDKLAIVCIWCFIWNIAVLECLALVMIFMTAFNLFLPIFTHIKCNVWNCSRHYEIKTVILSVQRYMCVIKFKNDQHFICKDVVKWRKEIHIPIIVKLKAFDEKLALFKFLAYCSQMYSLPVNHMVITFMFCVVLLCGHNLRSTF